MQRKIIKIMLVSITWSEYGVIILAALVVYYTVLVILYFKNEVLSLRFKKEQHKNNLSSEGNELYQADKELNSFSQNKIDDDISLVQETDETFQQVEELTASLKEAIAMAVDNEYVKEEFILSIQLLLKKYHFLKGSLFEEAINDLIISECEKYRSIHLSAKELVMLWKEVA